MTDDIFGGRVPRLRRLRAALFIGTLLFVTASAGPTALRAQDNVYFVITTSRAHAKVQLNERVFTADAQGEVAGFIPPGAYTLQVTVPDHPELKIKYVLCSDDQTPVPDASGTVSIQIRQNVAFDVHLDTAAPQGRQDPCYASQHAVQQGADPNAELAHAKESAQARLAVIKQLTGRMGQGFKPAAVSAATIDRWLGEDTDAIKQLTKQLRQDPNNQRKKEERTLWIKDGDYWRAQLERRDRVLGIKWTPLRENYPQALQQARDFETKKLSELDRKISDASAQAQSLLCQRIKVITTLYCDDVDYQAHKNARGFPMEIAFSGKYVGIVHTNSEGIGLLSMTPGSYQVTPRLTYSDAKLVSIIKHIPGNTPGTDESGPSLNFVAIHNDRQNYEYEVTVTIISYGAYQ
jgi:hypothetical protein